MRRNAKSRITLRGKDARLFLELKAKPGAVSGVEVVRRGLRLLEEVTDRKRLREAYRQASRATRAALAKDIDKPDHMAGEGVGPARRGRMGGRSLGLWEAIRAFRTSTDLAGLRLDEAYRGVRDRRK